MKLFSTDRKDAGKAVIWVFRPRFLTYPRLGWNHATPSGGPVLKTDVSWRNINGFFVRIGGSVTWVLFRRFWRI